MADLCPNHPMVQHDDSDEEPDPPLRLSLQAATCSAPAYDRHVGSARQPAHAVHSPWWQPPGDKMFAGCSTFPRRQCPPIPPFLKQPQNRGCTGVAQTHQSPQPLGMKRMVMTTPEIMRLWKSTGILCPTNPKSPFDCRGGQAPPQLVLHCIPALWHGC